MLLRFAIPCCFVVGLAAVVCLGVGCKGDDPSDSGKSGDTRKGSGGGATVAPGTSPATASKQPGELPPAVEAARNTESGKALVPGGEGKKVGTPHGSVTVTKLPDGTVVDEYDNKSYVRPLTTGQAGRPNVPTEKAPTHVSEKTTTQN